MPRYKFTPSAGFSGGSRYRIDTASGSTSAATIEHVHTAGQVIRDSVLTADPLTGALPSFAAASATLYAKRLTPSGTVTGSPVTLTGMLLDAAAAPVAMLASPALTGDPTVPTATPGDADTSVASTAFVSAAIVAERTSERARQTATYVRRLDLSRLTLTPRQTRTLVSLDQPVMTGTNTPSPTGQNITFDPTNAARFRVQGGACYVDAGSGLIAARAHPTLTNTLPPWSIEFVSDAPVFAIDATTGGTSVAVYVNDELVRDRANVSGGSWWQINWGTGNRAHRWYRLEMVGGCQVRGFRLNPADSLYAPPNKRPLRMGWMGDSYSGIVGTDGYSNMAMQVAGLLGVDLAASSQGSTGYDTATGGGQFSFQDRAATVAAAAPDFVVLAGGHNAATPTAVAQQAAAEATIATLRADDPDLPIYVLGVLHQGDGIAADYVPHNTGLAAAAASTGSVFISTVGWVTGTGRVGATAGDGNADVLITTDTVHPSAMGVDYFAARIANAIVNAA